jgi:hypothetical protein
MIHIIQVKKDGELYNAIKIPNKKRFESLQKKHKKGNYPVKLIYVVMGTLCFWNINTLTFVREIKLNDERK